MKKMMFVAALAAMVFTACTKEETVNDGAKSAIKFESYVGKVTKGAPVTAFKNGDKIKVWGYASKTAAMGTTMGDADVVEGLNGEVMTLSGQESWTQTTTAYWTAGFYHSFFAVSPETIAVADGVATVAVNSDVAQQEDLLIAEPIKQTAAFTGTAAPVVFTFRHVLCQVLFSAKVSVANDAFATNIRVQKITIAPADAAKFAEQGTVSMVGKVGSDAYTVTPAAGTTTEYVITPTTKLALTASAQEIKHADTNTAMLLPQDAPKFDITMEVIYNDVKNGGDKTTTIVAEAPAITWAANTRYNYTIGVDVDKMLNLEKIVIGNPSIDTWPTGTTAGN